MFAIKIDFYFERNLVREEDLQRVLNNALNRTEQQALFEIELNVQQGPQNIKPDENRHISFFELSSGSLSIMYLSGYLSAKNANLKFLLETKKGLDFSFLMNSNSVRKTDDILKFIYQKAFEDDILKVLQEIISSYFNFSNHIGKIWFRPSFNETIFVVGGPDFEENEKANNKGRVKHSLNTDIYGYGDKDTFIDSCIFLSKYFSGAKLIRCTSNDIIVDHKENMVIIGGPGTKPSDGNKYCKEFMEKMNTRFRYKQKKESEFCILANGKEYVADIDEGTNVITKDLGYFACFKNPHNPRKRVILINGLYTMGVLGAFLAFSDRERTEMNYEQVLMKAIQDDQQRNKMIRDEIVEFECLLEVEVVNNQPRVPVVKKENIYFFSSATNGAVARRNSGENGEINKIQEILQILQEKIDIGHPEISKLLQIKRKFNDGHLTTENEDTIYELLKGNTAIPSQTIEKLEKLLK